MKIVDKKIFFAGYEKSPEKQKKNYKNNDQAAEKKQETGYIFCPYNIFNFPYLKCRASCTGHKFFYPTD